MQHAEHASGIPYYPDASLITYNDAPEYAAEHDAAVDMWNAATPHDFLLQECPVESCVTTQYVLKTNSPFDNGLGVFLGWRTCQRWTEIAPDDLLTVRAFAFGHTPGNGDNTFTFVCLNDSALVNCSACFDDFDGPGVTTV